MNPVQWARVKALFHRALDHAPDERAAFVAKAAGEDADLRADLNRLLAAHAKAGNFIEQSPVSGGNGAAHASGARPVMTGRVIGRYEIGRLIGGGGMGCLTQVRAVRSRASLEVAGVPAILGSLEER